MEGLSDFLTNTMFIKILAAGLVAFFVVLLLIVLSIIVIVSVLARSAGSLRKQKKNISVEDLGRHLETYSMQVKKKTLSKKSFDKFVKTKRKNQKDQEKKNIYGPIAFVIDFVGDIKASQVQSLRDEISTVLEGG